ncbi:MAG TPA: hypothetical protein VFU54_03675 [Actinomycetota bacterium]|nr:hypothetical protein [Actinomycetota bacterium]
MDGSFSREIVNVYSIQSSHLGTKRVLVGLFLAVVAVVYFVAEARALLGEP